MNREQLHHQFEIIYQQLNHEQQEAVNTLYGPVLVIAGPGTGKTQILSARIGKILLDTDYLPENILCLTYTDAGRVAMRKRLQEMIGADAYRVNIHTFHSFCNQIIQENVNLFQKNTLDPISDLERVDLMKRIIDGFKQDNPLKRYRSDVYFDMDRLLRLISTMKKEGWSSDTIRNHIQQHLTQWLEDPNNYYKQTRDNYKKGDIKQKAYDEELKRMNQLQAAMDVYDDYQKLMLEQNRYDFEDMINWVIKALEEHDYLLSDLKEKYQFMLVDEFQDTSGTQNRLIELLCLQEEQPNIFVVGDDDQSIYRFQGANVENIEGFRSHYAAILKKIVLKNNYRSIPSVLEAAQHLIRNNQERLSNKDAAFTKDLQAAHSARALLQHNPELQVYENVFQEVAGVTEEVHRLIQSGIAANRIAILYKENKTGDQFIDFFKHKNISYYCKRKENLFDIPIAKKLLTILRYIAAETHIPYSGDELLFEILHYDLYQIPSIEIAKASVRVNDLKYDKKSSLRQYFQDWIHTKNRTLFDERPHEGLVHITSHLEKWIKQNFNTTVIQLVEDVMTEGGFLQAALQDKHDKAWQLEVLRSFMDFVKEEMQRHPGNTLEDLLTVVDLMESQGIAIPLYRVFGTDTGVNLTTVHGSKGLEYLYVFLVQSTASNWESKKTPSNGFKLPSTLFQTLVNNTEDQKLEEQRRLFFVALTRAEEHLIISWSKYDDKLKPLEPSRFIAEIREKMRLEVQPHSLDTITLEHYLELYLLRDKRPVLPTAEHDFIRPLLERFEMNATALNNYLKCPLRFYYQSLIRVPSGKNENTEFGSAVHFALEKFFTKRKENNDIFPTLDVFVNDFLWYMNKYRESFTREALIRRKEYGEKILTALYENYISEWNKTKVVVVERIFKGVVVEGVPLKGQIDKIEFNGNQVVVIDYKTGNFKNAKDKLKPPSAKEPLGGEYWRQGLFYKILIDHVKTNPWMVEKTMFQFVEPDDEGKYQYVAVTPNPNDIQTVREQIVSTWKKIQQHDFYTGCGKDDCHWCNFVKDNKQYSELKEALHEDEWEETGD